MQDPNAPVVCRECNRSVPLREIKFNEDKKQYVCNACFNAAKPTTSPKKEVNIDEKGTEKLLNDMIKYNCLKCKYHFSRAKGKEVKECPYCGSQNVEQANKDAANKILDESDEWQ